MLEICASYQVNDIEKPFQKEKYNKAKIHQLKISLTIIIIMYFNVYVLFDFFILLGSNWSTSLYCQCA